MSTTEIKRNLIKKIDNLRGRHLREIHGLVMNYVNASTLSWENLAKDEQMSIEEGLKQLDEGKGIAHEKVMARIRKKFGK